MAHGWPTTSALDQFKLKAKREKWDEQSCVVCTFHSWGRSESLNHRKQVEKMWINRSLPLLYSTYPYSPMLFKIIFWKLYRFKKNAYTCVQLCAMKNLSRWNFQSQNLCSESFESKEFYDVVIVIVQTFKD